MSAADRGFAHAQARVQARYGRLPAENDWQRISGIRGLGAWLEDARNGPHRDWVKGFSAASTAADIESGARELLLNEIDAVAGFVPEAWRDAVHWTQWLPLAGVIEHLRRSGEPPAWARQIGPLASLLGDDGTLAQTRLTREGLKALLDPDAGPVLTLWADAWRQRWPRPGAAARADLDGLAALLGQHLTAFRASSPQRAWTRRQALRERLRLRFHGLGLSPAAPFVYLVLVALDLERLRRALLDRALFPQAPATGTREEAA